MQATGLPHHQRTPVVTDEGGGVVPGGVEQTVQVGGEVADAIGRDVTRGRRESVAALIGCEHVVARGRQRFHLVAPRVRRLGKAVAQQHARVRRIAGLGDDEIDAVGMDGALANGQASDHGLAGPVTEFHQNPVMSTMKCTEPTSSPFQTLIW